VQLGNGDLKQQHICIKLCFKLGKNATGTFVKVACGEQTMGKTQVFE
jgi:hypothetical protein